MATGTRIIGIDLGTTNSVVSVVEGDQPIVIPNQEGMNKTPSVVAFLDNNECIVGEIARRQAATNPKRTITSIKRLIGLDFEELEEITDIFPYDVVGHDDKLLIDVNGLGYTPEQISSLIIKKLKESAEAFLGEEVNQAVITVPAHFNDSQRQATMEAASLAGLQVLRLINEPTAAAVAYGIGRQTEQDEVIAVYDFGGGTFDITILEISGKTFDVLTSSGDNRLGGDDLDNVLVGLLIEEFHEQHGVDLTSDAVMLRRLKEVAEKAKCELSSASQTSITLPFIAYKDGAPLHLDRLLTRDEFEELIEAFINKTIRCCKRAIEDAGIKKADVKKVILVGGSTRIPLVQDAVEDFFGFPPFKGINPDEVVALGAATQAGVFAGNIEEVTLLDVVPHSLGIEVKDSKFSKIIERNEKIPIKAAKNFTTTEDNQTFVNIHILQGESAESSENRSLGRFTLADIPPAPKGRARIRVTFFVNADGVMEISAEELGSGIVKSLTIVHSELDEAEKKVRKKARQRRKSGSSRGARTSSGAGDSAVKTYKLPAAADASGVQAAERPRSADSSVVRKSGSSSGGVAPAPTGFSVLGDTNPGITPMARASHPHQGSAAVPLPPTAQPVPPAPPVSGSLASPESDVVMPSSPSAGQPAVPTFGAPTRYTRPAQGIGGNPVPPILSTPIPAPPNTNESTMHERKDMDATQHLDSAGRPDPGSTVVGGPGVLSPQTDAFGAMDSRMPAEIERAFDFARGAEDSMEAQRAYTVALELFTKPPLAGDAGFSALTRLSLIRVMAGREMEALESLQRVVDLHSLAHRDSVNELLDRAVTRFSTSGAVRRLRGVFREQTGNLDGASDDYEFASKTDPKPEDAQDLERIYRLRIERSDDPSAQFKLVKIYLKSNRVDEAIEILQVLQSHQGYETRAVKILGLCHWQKNLHYLAWQKFKQLNQNEEIRDILYRLASDMESTGQLANALMVFEHIAEANSDYRDVAAKIKKLRYRIKMHEDEAQQRVAAPILEDPRFTIIEEINRGSMGIIFKAKDKTLDEVVALKVLNDYLCADPGAVERFKREARAAKKLSHPYIVRIHDMFETGTKRFISMEYIEGTDLKRLLAEKKSFTEDELIYYFMQTCDALSYAHNLNIIHRDIKPANVMITKDNTVKVTDFGIAKILKGDDSTKSGTAVIGTPLYMAPEQITGEGVDARSDIYALGIMMYELVSGTPPFYLGNIEYHHIHTAAPPLPEKVSPALRALIMKCIEKSPTNRFQRVDDLYEALRVASAPASS